jgi:hypothetical protein
MLGTLEQTLGPAWPVVWTLVKIVAIVVPLFHRSLPVIPFSAYNTAGVPAPAGVAGLPEACRPPDEASAYVVQDALHQKLSGAGLGTLAGHKIGCRMGGSLKPTADSEGLGEFRYAEEEPQENWEYQSRLDQDLPRLLAWQMLEDALPEHGAQTAIRTAIALYHTCSPRADRKS